VTKHVITLGRWLPAITIMVIIFLLSSINGNDLEMPPFLQSLTLQSRILDYLLRKSIHVILFGSLALSFEFGFSSSNDIIKKFIVYAVMLYGISDEIHQDFVPGREPSIIDVGIDTITGLGFTYRNIIGSKISSILSKENHRG
jgi:VanZ family protein